MEGDPALSKGKFVVADDPRVHMQSLEEMERRLFGYCRTNNKEQEYGDSEFIPIKS